VVIDIRDVRPSPLAGRWYPRNAADLGAMVDNFLESARSTNQSVPGEILGLLSPHAGLYYSGPVAAHAYALVQDMVFDTVVVIGPMHHPFAGAVLTTAHTAYETPLGQVPVDQNMLAALGERVYLTRLRNDPEHSVEIELPFLQRVLQPGFKFIPLMLRDQSRAQTKALGIALAEVLHDRRALFVASSDLSHFYTQEIANRLDTTMLEAVAAMDPDQVINYNRQEVAFACGHGAIAAVLQAVSAKGADRGAIVGYATSGDISGELDRVVGYGAAVFCKTA
jgi:MEMO1 family protein